MENGYTTSNDGYCHAIGYCTPFREWSDDSIASIFGSRDRYEEYIAPYRAAADKFHDGGHSTKEEACECYKQYLLDFDVSFSEDEENPHTLHKCKAQDCAEFTTGRASINGTMRDWFLCQIIATERNKAENSKNIVLKS